MAISRKGTKRLNHRDTQYLWIMKSRDGVNELTVFLSAAIDGQPLVAELPRVLTTDMISDGIDFALKNGWQPNKAGEPWRCKYTRKAFHVIEPGTP